jgi:hypothetical protein
VDVREANSLTGDNSGNREQLAAWFSLLPPVRNQHPFFSHDKGLTTAAIRVDDRWQAKGHESDFL